MRENLFSKSTKNYSGEQSSVMVKGSTFFGKASKKFFTFIAVLAISMSAKAQFFAVVGTGNGSNSSTGYPAPFGNWYYGAKHQMYITAAELSAAGILPGSFINSIGFNVLATNGAATHAGFQVRIFNTTAANPLSGGFINPTPIAVSTPSNVPAVTGWIQIPFTTFTWNGTDDFVVETCFYNSGGYTYNYSTEWTSALTGTTIKSMWVNQDGNPSICSTPYASSSTTTRPLMRFDWAPGTPCTGTPPANGLTPPNYTTCPSYTNPAFTFSAPTTYSFGGLQYTWQSSTISPVGPFTTVSGATLNSAPTPTLGVTTWFQAVVTCTNSAQSFTTPAVTVFVPSITTNTVQYDEGFEGIQFNFRLPNCSWAISSSSACLSYTSSQSGNRLPRTGSKFACFSNAVLGTNYYYSNGIYLSPGITYSASMWYQTDLTGANNWSNLEILYGATQTPTGLTSVAAVNGAVISPFYKSLSNTFTVSTAGLYYVAIRATAASGAAQFLSWDDLQISIPCQVSSNAPALTLNANSNNICAGTAVNLTASGANTYSWSTGSTASAITESPTTSSIYYVTGTNTLTGCALTVSTNVTVKPAPSVGAISYPAISCAGQPVSLSATGAGSYLWSNNSSGALITVTPTTATTYTVIGTNALGCSGSAVVTVPVNALPSVSALSSVPQACTGDAVILTASGANTYAWTSNTSPIILLGASVNAVVNTVGLASFTVVGTDNNNCSNSANVSLNINACTGLNSILASANGVNIYPNPTKGEFTVSFSNQTENSVYVMDVTGRVVSQFNNTTEEVQVNISKLSAGVYYVKVVSSNGVDVIKVIKE